MGAHNPDGYNFRESLLRRGITFCVYGDEELAVAEPDFFSYTGFIASLRHRLKEALIHGLGEETGAYASAMLLGMQSLIPSEDHEAFSNLGIAHILSVSCRRAGRGVRDPGKARRRVRDARKVRPVLRHFREIRGSVGDDQGS